MPTLKLRDMNEEEFDRWKHDNCRNYKVGFCDGCPFQYVNCSYGICGSWYDRKDLYTDAFLDQEVEIDVDTPILDEEEKIFLQKFVDLFPAKILNITKYYSSNHETQLLAFCYKESDEWNNEICFPPFKTDTKYRNMKISMSYSLEDLGLKERGIE